MRRYSCTSVVTLVAVFVAGLGSLAGAAAVEPVAQGYALPSKGIAPLTVTFDASASEDADGTIVSYHWNFGDDSDPEFGVRLTHEYTEAGEYTATLTVTDDDGYHDQLELTVIAYSLNDTSTVTLQDGLNGYSGTRDSTMYGWPGHGDRNFGALTTIKSGENDKWRPLFRFAVFDDEGGSVPKGAKIVSATLGLYKTSPYNATWSVYQLKRQFVESEVCWNKASAAEPWTVGGAGGDGTDRVADPVATPFIGWDPGWLMIDVTGSLQSISDGDTNGGWLLVEPVKGNIRRFASRENADQTIRPKLIISYTLPPEAVIATTPDPAEGFAPLTVTFDGSGSQDSDGTILFHYWNFGDGEFGEGEVVEHTYENPGLYEAVLTVTDDQGTTGTASVWVSVTEAGGPPSCLAEANPTSGAPPLTVQFTGTASDVGGTIESWHWDFGDDEESTDQNPTHVYQVSGRYTAVLTVTDNDDLTAQASVYVEVEQPYTLTFREGDGGEFSDFEDCNLKERYPDYHEERSEYLETQSAAGNVRRCLIRLRDIIGHAQGQIPHDAKIISAKLRLRPGSTTGQQIAVYRITEGWSIPYGSPKWPTRRAGGAPWGSPGCGYTDEANKSHLQNPEDVLTLTSQPFPYEWDVTQAVRAWANDADLNQGFVVEAVTSGSSFSSSDSRWEHWRPMLLVTLSDLPDIQKPKLAITSQLVSDTKRAFIEGTKDPEVDTINLTAGGEAVAVVVTNPTRWHAFVERDGSNSVELAATSTDSTGNVTTVTDWLTFLPQDAASAASFTIQAGDSALMMATSEDPDAESVEVVPGNGGSTVTGAVGETLEVPYPAPGAYTATVKVLDDEGSVVDTYEVDVTAIRVTMKEGMALQMKQGYRGSGPEPYYEVTVEPASAAGLVHLFTEKEDLLTVKPREVIATGVQSKIVMERPSTPYIQARLSGVTGRVLGRETITGFWISVSDWFGNAATDEGAATFHMEPRVPGLRIHIKLGFGATYLDGTTEKDFSSDELDEDGNLRIDAEVPDSAPDFETTTTVFQTLNPVERNVGRGYINSGWGKLGLNPEARCRSEVEDAAVDAFSISGYIKYKNVREPFPVKLYWAPEGKERYDIPEASTVIIPGGTSLQPVPLTDEEKPPYPVEHPQGKVPPDLTDPTIAYYDIMALCEPVRFPRVLTLVEANLKDIKDAYGDQIVDDDEEEATGVLLRFNNDDDDGDGKPDYLDDEIKPGDNDYVSMRLVILPPDVKSGTPVNEVCLAKTRSGTGDVKVYDITDTSARLDFSDPLNPPSWNVQDLPRVLWVEGSAVSSSMRDVELRAFWATDATELCPDVVKITVVEPNLTIWNGGHDLDNGIIKPSQKHGVSPGAKTPPAPPVPDDKEESLGSYFLVNWDNDDNDPNYTPDLEKNRRVQHEDNLARLDLDVQGLTEGIVFLEVEEGGERVRFWEDPEKVTEVTELEWTLPQDTVPETLWVEGVNTSASERDVVISLTCRLGRVEVEDTVAATVVMINLGNAVYREGTMKKMLRWFRPRGHAALVTKFKGPCDRSSLNNDKKFMLTEMHKTCHSTNTLAAITNAIIDEGKKTERKAEAWGCHTNTAQGVMTYTRRLRILKTAAYFKVRGDQKTLGYCATDALRPHRWNGVAAKIKKLRCDGLVEVCYELAGVDVWGKTRNDKCFLYKRRPFGEIGPFEEPFLTYYLITAQQDIYNFRDHRGKKIYIQGADREPDNLEEHNDFDFREWDRTLMPATQCGHEEPVDADTRFRQQDLCMPIGATGGNP